MIELERLQTEQRNPRTKNIDCLPTLDVVRLLNEEDKTVPLAIEKILPQIAEAVDLIADHLAVGGRLFYQGAGTSGRLGILDAVECPPTYRTDPSRIVGLIAGGTPAIFRAQEGAEDRESLGAEDLRKHDFTAADVLVGIAASGRTPYVLGGLHYARSLGAATIALTCSKNSPAAAAADLALEPVTGPEAITGSTRMKAGTAQKLVLNMLSTAAMIKLGKTYGNLMIDVNASNAKLMERAIRIVMEISGSPREEAAAALSACGGSAKLASLVLLTGDDVETCRKLLADKRGKLRDALKKK